jgi:SAM-dependent methyltransferase
LSANETPSPLEATGERLIPEDAHGELVLGEHLARYVLATRLAPGRRVLDAACGEGYGTAMIARAGAVSAVGVDVDQATVAHARGRYGLDFQTADVTAMPFEDGTFDLVVSFETIEHVADPQRALDELARVAGPDGLVLVSTPNAEQYLQPNPFHVRELTPDEFLAALGARFAEVRPLFQQNFLTSAILDVAALAADDGEAPLRLDARKVAGVEPGGELYTLALCGPPGLVSLEADVAVLAGVYEAHDLAAQLREWQARATEAERQAKHWQEAQGEWEARAREAERQNAELRATIDRIAASLSWRLTKPLRAVRGRSR